MPDKIETYEIKDVDIFAAGHWNGDDYTEQDLDNIVTAFEATKDRFKPYIKIGHSDEQKLLANDELPAAGFVENLRRVGKKLVADFVNVPGKIYELIKKKLYSRISSELFVNARVDQAEFPLALKAVAILGGETPAVNTLDDILALTSDQRLAVFGKDSKFKNYDLALDEFTKIDQEEVMTVELKAEVEKLNGELKTYQDRAAKAEAEIKRLSDEARIKSIDLAIEGYAEKGKILPSQKSILKDILVHFRKVNDELKFTANGKEVTDLDGLVAEFVALGDNKLNIDGPKSNLKTQDEDVVEKARAYAQEKGISFKKALIELWPASEGDEPEVK